MPCKYSKSKVGETQDALKSIVGSFLRKGFSIESIAEGFLRQSQILLWRTNLPDPRTHRMVAPTVTVHRIPVQVVLLTVVLRILRTLVTRAIVVTLPAAMATMVVTLLVTLQTRILAVTARMSIALVARTLHHRHLV